MKHPLQHNMSHPFFHRLAQAIQAISQRLTKRRFLLLCLGAFLTGILFVLGLAGATYWGFFGDLPTYGELSRIQNHIASEVYSDDGVLLRKYYVENRVNADFDEIPLPIIHALVATEDARYFEHSGIDFWAWGRVVVKSILLQDERGGGGSTISQQLVKNLYGRREYGAFSMMVNKLKETFTARRLEKIYSKEDLLKLYLNTVPFGDNIFGIKVAAQHFFSKAPDDLTIEEGAVLVGMLKANSLFHPVRYPARASDRRNVVLRLMTRYGYLTPEERDSLISIPLVVHPSDVEMRQSALYFTEHLRLEVNELLKNYKKENGQPYDLYRDGLKIYTTIDSRLQRYAEEAINEHLADLQLAYYKEWKTGTPWKKKQVLADAIEKSARYQSLKGEGYSEAVIDSVFRDTIDMTVYHWKDGGSITRRMSPLDSIKYYLTLLNAGFLAMEPQTGALKAWVGGVNYRYFQYDHVKSNRQVGSIFKPIVYAQALRKGVLPCEYTENQLVTYVNYNNWQPNNSDNKYGGVYSMEGALTHSVNTIAVDMVLRAGMDSVKWLAGKMGMDGEIPVVPSMALGTMSGSLYDMIQVYGTFVNDGKRPEHYYLKRIENNKGEAIATFDPIPNADLEPVLSAQHARMMVEMLTAVVDSGTARRLRYEYGLYQNIAGKTGTTQNHADGWFIGMIPNLVAGAWVGGELPVIHFKTLRRGQGAHTALPIWGKFMKQVNKDPQFANWRKQRFKALNPDVEAYLSCPPFLEEQPVFDEFWSESTEVFAMMTKRFPYLTSMELLNLMESKPQRRFESIFEYAERLQNYYEKLEKRDERRDRRKAYWEKLFFNKKNRND